MATQQTFREWFTDWQRITGRPASRLREELIVACRIRGAAPTDSSLKSILDGKHEPRRKLRAALMAITGLPATAFLLPSALDPVPTSGAAPSSEVA